MRAGLVHSILAVLVIPVNQLIAMDAVKRKHYHHKEVRNQECSVKRIPVIQVLESAIRIMRPEIVGETVLGRGQPQGPYGKVA